jgi:hypothetical protein
MSGGRWPLGEATSGPATVSLGALEDELRLLIRAFLLDVR